MSEPQQQPRKKGKLAILLAFARGFVIGYISSCMIDFFSSLAPEYNSASAIREITKFVQQNETWPTSWSDLSTQPLDGVRVNWSLNISACDRYDVMTSVSPTTGGFYTYPHAGQQLGELWQLVSKIQNKRSNHGNARSLRKVARYGKSFGAAP